MSDEILELMDNRKKAKNTPEYKELNKEVQKKCRKEKERLVNAKFEEIELSDRNNATKKIHVDIKELSVDGTGKAGSCCIKDKINGDLIF